MKNKRQIRTHNEISHKNVDAAKPITEVCKRRYRLMHTILTGRGAVQLYTYGISRDSKLTIALK